MKFQPHTLDHILLCESGRKSKPKGNYAGTIRNLKIKNVYRTQKTNIQ